MDYDNPHCYDRWLSGLRKRFAGFINEPVRIGGSVVDVIPVGWRQIAEATIASTAFIRDNDPAARASRIVQIKEKFGSIRIYVRDGTDEQQAMYQLAEVFTRTACEVCGRPGPPAPSPDACRCPEHPRGAER